MARATRSTTALQQQPQQQIQRKRKRNSSPGQIHASKLQKTDENDNDIHHPDSPVSKAVFLPELDAQKILDILELSDTQGLLDRVFPSSHVQDALFSLRTLLKHPAEHPLTTIKAAINNLFPISSLPRSRPSPAASQQLEFSNLALSLLEQASFNVVPTCLDKTSILESSLEEENAAHPARVSPTLTKRKYALVQHLPQGDYWTSISSETASSDLTQLPVGHAELVAILPSSSSTSIESVPTLGSVSSRPLGPTKPIQQQRRVTAGGFLDYGPFASFAPCFDQNGEIVGQRQLGELLYQKEQQKREAAERQRQEMEGVGSVEDVPEKAVMNGDVQADCPNPPVDIDEELNSLLPPEDVKAIKEALGNLELENAVQQLLERNQRALGRLEELQRSRLNQSGSGFTPVEEGSEEWETAQCIMDSLATLASLRPHSSDTEASTVIPPPAVLRKLHRSLALEPSPGWYGNIPATRATALHDDSTIKVKPPAAMPATTLVTPAAPSVPAVQTTATTPYPTYAYNYSPAAQQQQSYRPAAATYTAYKPGQNPTYYQSYMPTTAQQSHYNQQSYAGTSTQQPYGATAQQPYAYQNWYAQYQQASSAAGKATPQPSTATAATYGSFFNGTSTSAAANGAPAARSPAVANTASNKANAVGQQAPTPGVWPPPAYQAVGVAPTLPAHLRTTQAGTPASPLAAGSYQAPAGYYPAYQTQTATPTR